MAPENATAQLGEPGPWQERLPHFRMAFVPSSGDELQSEYLVPARHAAAVWRELAGMRSTIHPVLQVSEVRAVAADPMWLSLTGGEPSVAFHFTWINDEAAVRPVLGAVETRLAGFDARPHWGKVFGLPPDALSQLYPRLPDFRCLVTQLDPTASFGTPVVDGWIGLR
jgi:xylitol oxidase